MYSRKNRQVPNVNDFWVWRHEYHYNQTGALSMNTAMNYTLLTANFSHPITVYEDSLLRFTFHGMLDKIGANGWSSAIIRLQDITTPFTCNRTGGFAYHLGGYAGTASFSTVGITSYIEQNAADPATTYRIEYYVYTTNRLQLLASSFGIDICRV